MFQTGSMQRILKYEGLNQFIFFGQRHLRDVIKEYVEHYHTAFSSGARRPTDQEPAWPTRVGAAPTVDEPQARHIHDDAKMPFSQQGVDRWTKLWSGHRV